MIQAITLLLYCIRLKVAVHFDQGPIAETQFYSNNREGIPNAMMGLQALWRDENVRVGIFEILKSVAV
ncbi:MAG: hypothetical protein OXH03_04070 [Bacteroidetes bacterium]|nr:hypothetical protein [Bacteroidota bacterium]MDE2672831.1 hypothetical protein [Bacteroidota bacterium]